MSIAKKALILVVVVLVIMQFFPIDTKNPPVVQSENFFDMFHTPDSIKTMIKNSCYDCHSNETVYPGYSKIAPFSYMIKHHIDEGREHLNFSEFGTYSKEEQRHVMEETSEVISEGEMPMKSYVWMHSEAKLSDEEKLTLINYFNQIRHQISK